MRRPADSWRPVCRELLLLKALLSKDFEDSKANRAAQNKVGHGFISSFRALFRRLRLWGVQAQALPEVEG